MKNQLIVLTQKKLAATVGVMLCMLVLPLVGISQATPPPPGSGGGSVDAVPFDDNMNLLFLAVGIVFAMIVVIKRLQQRKKAVV